MVHPKTFYLTDFVPNSFNAWGCAIFVLAAGFGEIINRLAYSNPPMSSFRVNNMRTNAVFEIDGPR